MGKSLGYRTHHIHLTRTTKLEVALSRASHILWWLFLQTRMERNYLVTLDQKTSCLKDESGTSFTMKGTLQSRLCSFDLTSHNRRALWLIRVFVIKVEMMGIWGDAVTVEYTSVCPMNEPVVY